MDQSKKIIDSIFGSSADSDDDDAQTNANISISEAKLTEIRDDLIGVGGHRGLFALHPLPPGIMVAILKLMLLRKHCIHDHCRIVMKLS